MLPSFQILEARINLCNSLELSSLSFFQVLKMTKKSLLQLLVFDYWHFEKYFQPLVGDIQPKKVVGAAGSSEKEAQKIMDLIRLKIKL